MEIPDNRSSVFSQAVLPPSCQASRRLTDRLRLSKYLFRYRINSDYDLHNMPTEDP